MKYSLLLFILISSAIFAGPVYPPSKIITGITFNMSTLRNSAPGNGKKASDSDNWAITWADDGHQYTVFGDGVGFGTSNNSRASNGVARIEGGKSNYSAYDVFKTGGNSGGWDGKSLGIISIDGVMWMFRNGTGSGNGAFDQTELYKSTNHGASWTFTGVDWDFPNSNEFYSPTFVQFGQDYAGARDNFVYIFLNEVTNSVSNSSWNVQKPGRISLMRVPKESLDNKSAYEYYTGSSWSSNLANRRPVFEDSVNGTMRTSVSYNPALKLYILTTQQVSRLENGDYHIGIYEAPEPWGPWSTVWFANASDTGPNLNNDIKTVYWNFSNKWLSADGKNFVMVCTCDGADQWGTVEGSFEVDGVIPPTDKVNPNPPTNLIAE